VLAGFDADVREHLTQELSCSGLALHMSRRVERIAERAHALSLVLDDGLGYALGS
jgi:hypothetical protein